MTAARWSAILVGVKVIDKARVLLVRDGRAEVALAGDDDPARCTACAMASRCAAGERRLSVPASDGLKPGDEVTVEMEVASPAWAAFLLFMLPLAAAFLAGGTAFGLTGSGALGAVSGAAGAGCVYLGLYLHRVWRGGSGSEVTAAIVRRPGPGEGREAGGAGEPPA